MKSTALAIGVLLTLCLPIQADAALSQTEIPKCLIWIRTAKTTGELYRFEFSSPLRTYKECQTLARFHTPNFSTATYRTKKVSFFWTGRNLKLKRNEKAKAAPRQQPRRPLIARNR